MLHPLKLDLTRRPNTSSSCYLTAPKLRFSSVLFPSARQQLIPSTYNTFQPARRARQPRPHFLLVSGAESKHRKAPSRGFVELSLKLDHAHIHACKRRTHTRDVLAKSLRVAAATAALLDNQKRVASARKDEVKDTPQTLSFSHARSS